MSLPIMRNQFEERFCNLMLHWCRNEMSKQQAEVDALEGKKFPYGTWVSIFNDVFDKIGAGKVVGWNSEDQCYKVAFEDTFEYVPYQPIPSVVVLNIQEKDLREFHGDSISLSVANYNHLSIHQEYIRMIDIINECSHDKEFTEAIFPANDREVNASNKAILGYRKMVEMIQQDESFLKFKKFHFGDIVIKKGTNKFDKLFNVGEGRVGKIVGYDRDNDYYRVFYNTDNSYIGVKENELEEFSGTVPDEVLNHDPYDIDMFLLHLK